MKAAVKFILEPATMLQGDVGHPVMLMDTALYTEPVKKTVEMSIVYPRCRSAHIQKSTNRSHSV